MNSEVVFLRGFPRSGTNWVCNLLNLHPDIRCVGEFHLQRLFMEFQNFLSFHGSRIYRKKEFTDSMSKLFYDFIRKTILSASEPALMVCDRTPAPIESMIIPDSKYLLITRDGRDTLVSWYYHILRRAESEQIVGVFNRFPELMKKVEIFKQNPNYFEGHPYKLLDCEKFFRERARAWNKCIIDDMRTMAKIDSREINISCLWIRYENLHENVEKIRNEIYTFLKLDPQKAGRLNRHTMAGFDVHNPLIHNRIGAVGRWRKYYTPEYAHWFDEEAHEALDMLGFQPTIEALDFKGLRSEIRRD